MEQRGLILNFTGHRTLCSWCNKPFLRNDRGGNGGHYCEYTCGVYAQPDYTREGIYSAGGKKTG